MKLIAPSSDEVMRRIIRQDPARLAGGVMFASGEYEVQPDCAAPPGTKKRREHHQAADDEVTGSSSC